MGQSMAGGESRETFTQKSTRENVKTWRGKHGRGTWGCPDLGILNPSTKGSITPDVHKAESTRKVSMIGELG